MSDLNGFIIQREGKKSEDNMWSKLKTCKI